MEKSETNRKFVKLIEDIVGQPLEDIIDSDVENIWNSALISDKFDKTFGIK